jgi:mRNA interferase RelE/StbE
MYNIILSKRADKVLSKIPKLQKTRLINAIEELGVNPRPFGYIKLTLSPYYRIRVGNYRILYLVEDDVRKVVNIDYVLKRNERTYKNV